MNETILNSGIGVLHRRQRLVKILQAAIDYQAVGLNKKEIELLSQALEFIEERNEKKRLKYLTE